MSVRYESLLISVKVLLVAGVIELIAFNLAGRWMNVNAKWSLYACFLSIEIALNMSLWLKRVTIGLSARFKDYSFTKLTRASLDCSKGPLSQTTIAFLGECSKILGKRFERITGLPGKILVWPGLFCSVLTVVLFVVGVPSWAERYLAILLLPSLLYYLFVLLAYCDVVVQMDGVCIDLRQTKNEEVATSQLLPEVISIGKEAGLLLH